MIDWTAKARALSQSSPDPTDRTDETPLVSVSSVPPAPFDEEQEFVSSVSSAPAPVYLIDAKTLEADLLEAAMRVCDRWGDGANAREEMVSQCLALTSYMQADLLDHFRGKRPAFAQGVHA